MVAMLRLVADPTAGAAAMRVLTGPRWRLGGRDIAALWRRAVELDGAGGGAPIADRADRRAGRPGRRRCLPGRRDLRSRARRTAYSPDGYRRIVALGRELTALRAQLRHPLPELVAEVRRVLGVDAEVRAARRCRRAGRGTEHLDAFADVVADFAARPAAIGGRPAGLPGRRRGGGERAGPRRGNRRARPRPDPDRARRQGAGVAGRRRAAPERTGVPVDRVDADLAHRRRRPAAAAARRPRRPCPSTAFRCSTPPTSTIGRRCPTRSRDHKRSLDQRRVDEERRLLYVAITRAEDTLLLSGHHWGATETKPRGPSEFLVRAQGHHRAARPPRVTPCGVVEQWAPAPPTATRTRCGTSGRSGLARRPGGLAPRRRGPGRRAGGAGDVGWGWPRDASTWTRAGRPTSTPCSPNATARPSRPVAALPAQLSVSTLVDLGRDPERRRSGCDAGCRRRPDPHALLGTAFHDWVQRFYRRRAAVRPRRPARRGRPRHGARRRGRSRRAAGRVRRVAVGRAHPDRRGGAVRHGDRRHAWCAAASTRCSPTTTAAPPWSTGRPAIRPTRRRPCSTPPFSSAVYRLAWAAMQGCPASSVRAAFHYVRSGQTVTPDDAARR